MIAFIVASGESGSGLWTVWTKWTVWKNPAGEALGLPLVHLVHNVHRVHRLRRTAREPSRRRLRARPGESEGPRRKSIRRPDSGASFPATSEGALKTLYLGGPPNQGVSRESYANLRVDRIVSLRASAWRGLKRKLDSSTMTAEGTSRTGDKPVWSHSSPRRWRSGGAG